MDEGQLDKIARKAGLMLFRDADGLALSDGTMTLRADFSHMAARLRPDNLSREMLVRATRLKRCSEALTAIDATAGLGEDALLLAAAGFHVTLYERNPVVAALLADAIARARIAPKAAGGRLDAETELSPAGGRIADAAGRMQLVEADSVAALARLGFQPDIVYLDPMFPAKRGDARAKKKLQMLQRLEMPAEDGDILLGAALAAHPHKVVVKRPARGPHLAGRKPSYSISGKTIRYDCYLGSSR